MVIGGTVDEDGGADPIKVSGRGVSSGGASGRTGQLDLGRLEILSYQELER